LEERRKLQTVRRGIAKEYGFRSLEFITSTDE